MIASYKAHKKKHDNSLKRHPTMKHEQRIMNQVNDVPDIINKRVANMELRRLFLEGQNIRNSASEKQRLNSILAEHSVPMLPGGRFRPGLNNVMQQALADRVTQLDDNPANRPFVKQHPTFRPIIGEQPRFMFT
jgi:hypothetical protein